MKDIVDKQNIEISEKAKAILELNIEFSTINANQRFPLFCRVRTGTS